MLWNCTGRAIYDNHCEIGSHGWESYDKQAFLIDVPRTGVYDVDMFLMHDNDYRYRNVWLFIEYLSSGDTLVTDTVNCLLADTYGRWYGGGWGAYYQYEQRLKEAVRLDSGRYEVYIAQGMRERNLKGIAAVGLRVTLHQTQEEAAPAD